LALLVPDLLNCTLAPHHFPPLSFPQEKKSNKEKKNKKGTRHGSPPEPSPKHYLERDLQRASSTSFGTNGFQTPTRRAASFFERIANKTCTRLSSPVSVLAAGL
jgi:hypothetical protein